MTKTLCSILVGTLAATLLVATAGPSSAAVQTQGFESAVPTGWTAKNNSEPVGFRSVFQGDPTTFSAHDGPATSYAAMNYSSASGAHATISTWLITPKYTSLSNGDAWSFFTRTTDAPAEGWVYPDRLEVRMSTNGGCSPGTGASAVGDFTTLLTTINPALQYDGYPVTWTQVQGALAGITGGVKAGCLAFRYYVQYAGSTEVNGDYIGIDSYSFDDQPADTTPPDTTITSGPTGITADSTPTFAFTSTESGSTFECAVDGAAYGACSGPGASHTTATLSEGAHTLAVRATDDMLNTDPTPATRTFTVDAAAPDTTITSGPGGLTNDSTPTFAFSSTETGSTFECAVDDAAYAACSEPDGSHTTSVLDDGPHTLAVRATDTAGHAEDSPATTSFTVDTAVPDTSITSGPDGLTNDPTPTFGVASTEEDSTFECSVDQAEFTACSGPGLTLPTMSDDDHVVAVRAVDAAGNVDPTPAVRELTVDTTAPETTIESAPPTFTHDPTPAFEFTAGDGVSTYECALDDAEFAACAGSDGAYTAPSLDDGSHSLAVRATDPAGNTDASPAQADFTVDTAAPGTSITAGPSGDTRNAQPTFEFTSDEIGSTYECSLDGAAYDACSGPGATHTTSALTDGSHSFAVRATDPAGNTDASPAQADFTVDTAAPDTTITTGPTGDTRSTRPTFEFTSTQTGSTYECSLDGGAFVACSGPGATHTTSALTDGTHSFAVRATDPAGNTDASPAQADFTVDTAAPDTTITAGPSGDTRSTRPTFEFTSTQTGSTYECSVDGAAYDACSGPGATHTTQALTDGNHSFTVRATDPAGNTDANPAQADFTVDTTAPDTTITTGPTGDTQSTRPTFAFTSTQTGSTYECSTDGAAYDACSGPGATHTTSALADGVHTLAVRATDPAGNTDASPARADFTVDTAAPDTTITAGPSGDTQITRPTFAFTSTETGSTYQCSLDGAAYAACSGPGPAHTTTALAVGAHTFVVRATDRAGNEDPLPAIRSFTVVSPPPSCAADQASVTKAKAAVTKATTALTKATKKLKAAKKAGKPKVIARAKKVVTAASKKVKTAKRTLVVATGRLTACQGG